MWACCLIVSPASRSGAERWRAQPGFTLLEMLVVMAIIGLAAATVVPVLTRVVAAVRHSGEVQDIVDQLGQLSLRAYSSGKPIVLSEETQKAMSPATVELPSGWALSIAQPIHFNAMGLCDGGSVSVVAPDGDVTIMRLAAPDCAIALDAKR